MPEGPRIVGIVLAAGQSSRMGRPKALLSTGATGETFTERVVRTLWEGGVNEVVVVGRAVDEPLRTLVAALGPRCHFVENADPLRGQLSSLLAGLDRAEALGAAAVMVMPVDVPSVRAETIAIAAAAIATGPLPIARLTHDGRHGHPVLFRSSMFPELRAADPSIGARAVLRADPGRVANIDVRDPGVVRDVDVPADYLDLFGREVP